MKKKRYIFGLVMLLVVIIGSVALMMDRKVQIVAATTIFKEQQWQVQLSQPLRTDSIANGQVYIKNLSGNKIAVPIELTDDAKTLKVKGLKAGDYKLHITKQAFASKGLRKTAQTIDFAVVEKLESVTSEKQLRQYFEAIIAQQEQQNRNSNWDLEIAEEQSASMNDSAAGDAKTSSYSDTNNQVEGIEEGDVTVTDGRFIYTLRDQELVILNVQQKDKAQVASSIMFKDQTYPTQLMLHEQYLLVTYDEYTEYETKEGYYDSKTYTKTAIYDVSDAANPQLLREIGQEGYKLGVRKSGNMLYVVTGQSPNYWLLNEGLDVDLRPAIYDSNESDEAQSLPLERITILPNSLEPSYMNISALDLNNLQQGELTVESFLGSSDQLYMSEQAIYVTAIQYEYAAREEAATSRMMMDIAWVGNPTSTQLYKFGINGAAVNLVAQTTVPGMVLNQFSMDEYNGYFRVATTQYAFNARDNSSNNLFIYDERLNEVGKLTDLARGERIYSARFMGDKAYVVTFKEVDPLFVIDVANPAAPKVLGELKIPGFSNYLHPIDETHLLGIGYDTAVRTDSYSKEPIVESKGMKVALFDVSDLANPKEQDAVIIGGRGTYSSVQYEHKALFRDVKNSLYGFPISIYEEAGEYESKYIGTGALIYKVTVEDGIELVGDLVEDAVADEQYEDWETAVQRIIYVDDILYTVARKELRSYQMPTFNEVQVMPY